MSKLFDPNQYLKLSNYSEKYNVSVRKLYRYRDDNKIDFLEIDGIPFIKDQQFTELMVDHRYSNDKIMTINKGNVKKMTINEIENAINQGDSNVKKMTIANDKIMTLSKEELELLNKPEEECSISDFDKIGEIQKKIRDYNIKI